MSMPRTLAIVIGRAGSRGLPGKNALPLLGIPLVLHSVVAARGSRHVSQVIVSTDGAAIADAARRADVPVIARPAALATDTATVASAARHALQQSADPAPIIVILYANVPVRPAGLIDEAIELLLHSGADSVQSYAPVGRHHPLWAVSLDDRGRVTPYAQGRIDRRQDLPVLHFPDGGVIAVRREFLLAEDHGDPHAFFGQDRRGIVTAPGAVVDVDTAADLELAAATLRGVRGRALGVGARRIGPQEPPFVIAEIGVNHDGSRERMVELVIAAARAGADAVKTQYFRADLLLGRDAGLTQAQTRSGAASAPAMLRALELSDQDLVVFCETARAEGLEPIVTVFSPELVGAAAAARPEAWKIASPDLVNRPLLDALLEHPRPMLVSTGASEPFEILETAGWLARVPHAFLQCVSAYPTAPEHAALGGITALRDLLGDPVGYSDHTTLIETGALAVAAGAAMLEKHLTWSTTAPGPDHATSLTPDALARYVQQARCAWAMRGAESKHTAAVELEVRRLCRQSVILARPVAAGAVLGAGDLAVRRPGTGMPAARITAVIGRTVTRDVDAGETLCEDDLA
ncbi:MAG: N-acetylneuraminate synthase family protein [Phycisphaeraceae bacterium]|nr:N-acetylneuraminate synthase family protein [Phycisphaeraceae bacterium]